MADRRIRELRQQLLDEAQRLAFRRADAETFAESDRISRLIRALEEAATTLEEALNGDSAEEEVDRL